MHFILTHLNLKIQGFERAYDFMPEISIDVPAAYGILERFVTRCRADGILTDELVRKMPSRYAHSNFNFFYFIWQIILLFKKYNLETILQ